MLACLLAVATVVGGCRTGESYREEVLEELQMGDLDGAEAVLREGLERHPGDVALLVTAGEFYLTTFPEERYKPRLALHYAMRADRAADNNDEAAAALLVRAWRANGGSPMGDRLVEDGLAQLGHDDVRAPKRLGAADPDLLDPSAANLREQARRDRQRATGEDPCGAGLGYVAAATWEIEGGREVVVGPLCAERGAPAGTCSARGLRACTPDEVAVLCGPMKGVLGHHPACIDATVGRCCAPTLTDPGAPGPAAPAARSPESP